jgi:hydroxymethylbilane synthase
LARWQADWVAARLRENGVDVELVPITTSGDRLQQGPIGAIGDQGLFTKEIQRALLDDRIDLAVHSLKDLPTDEVAGLSLAAVPERAPVGDVLVCRKYGSLDALPEGAVVGSGSLRRRSQLLRVRPDLQVKDIRGNVETRVRKLETGDYDAIVLAEAGVRRLGLESCIAQLLPLSILLPAIGQGALGLETRTDDDRTCSAVGQLDHLPTHAGVRAERTMLAVLRGGCRAPIAGWGRVENDALTLQGRVLSPDGSQCLEATLTGGPAAPEQLGRRLAEDLIARGAAQLIRASREMFW